MYNYILHFLYVKFVMYIIKLSGYTINRQSIKTKRRKDMPDYENRLLVHPRGSIWKCKFPELDSAEVKPGVQTGYRPVLILSSDIGNYTNESVVIALITSNKVRAKLSINVGFENASGDYNVILCNQLQTVHKSRLTTFMGVVPEYTLKEVDKAIKTALFIQDSSVDIQSIESIVDRIIEAKTQEIKEESIITQESVNNIAEKLEELFKDVLLPFEKKIKQKQIEEVKEVAPIATALTGEGTYEELEQQENTDYSRKPRGYWTEEKKKEFILDRDKMTFDELIKKWGIKDKKTAYQLYYRFNKSVDK